MDLSIDLMLTAVGNAIGKTLIPALPAGNRAALEQAHLCLKVTEIIRRQIKTEATYLDGTLARYRDCAVGVMASLPEANSLFPQLQTLLDRLSHAPIEAAEKHEIIASFGGLLSLLASDDLCHGPDRDNNIVNNLKNLFKEQTLADNIWVSDTGFFKRLTE
jgi:hypothetical protein